ncbi:MAG: hypothetical protein WBQ73_00790 [Candidatus Babeliales bacterium]
MREKIGSLLVVSFLMKVLVMVACEPMVDEAAALQVWGHNKSCLSLKVFPSVYFSCGDRDGTVDVNDEQNVREYLEDKIIQWLLDNRLSSDSILPSFHRFANASTTIVEFPTAMYSPVYQKRVVQHLNKKLGDFKSMELKILRSDLQLFIKDDADRLRAVSLWKAIERLYFSQPHVQDSDMQTAPESNKLSWVYQHGLPATDVLSRLELQELIPVTDILSSPELQSLTPVIDVMSPSKLQRLIALFSCQELDHLISILNPRTPLQFEKLMDLTKNIALEEDQPGMYCCKKQLQNQMGSYIFRNEVLRRFYILYGYLVDGYVKPSGVSSQDQDTEETMWPAQWTTDLTALVTDYLTLNMFNGRYNEHLFHDVIFATAESNFMYKLFLYFIARRSIDSVGADVHYSDELLGAAHLFLRAALSERENG